MRVTISLNDSEDKCPNTFIDFMADNKTPAGRAENNLIELELIQ